MSASTIPGNRSSHWYCHVTFDVTDHQVFMAYLRDQVGIEQLNGMTSYEFFVDHLERPTQAVLIECFPDDVAQQKHLENIRTELFLAGLSNPKISVLGTPPQTTRDRMLEHGYWPPAFEGEFQHLPHLGGFR